MIERRTYLEHRVLYHINRKFLYLNDLMASWGYKKNITMVLNKLRVSMHVFWHGSICPTSIWMTKCVVIEAPEGFGFNGDLIFGLSSCPKRLE